MDNIHPHNISFVHYNDIYREGKVFVTTYSQLMAY